ncbi:MAG TPA: hypothetical protein VEX39_16385 [Thermoleophilaceae bacterium]|nr:hypothetical protein [Thermoleophilaceae bacterium]
MLVAACALSGAVPSAASARTYVPNCGTTYYLDFKPSYWSGGCTGGALNVNKLRWRHYGNRTAKATGQAALRRPCGTNPTCPEAGLYRASARLYMSRPSSCRNGEAGGARFFSRITVRVRYRADNPFGYRAGWKRYRSRVRAYEGTCEYSP